MASIEKRGEGYRVRWRDPDGTARSRQTPTLTVARQLVKAIEAAEALGRRWEPAVARSANPVDEAMVAYLTQTSRTKALRTLALRRAGLERFRAFLQLHTGKDKVLSWDLLSRKTLESWDLALAAEGLRASTRGVYLGIVQLFWSWAYDDEVYGPDVPRPRKVERPLVVAKPVRAPTWEQMDRTIALLGNQHVRTAAILMRCLGWRIKQVVGVRWDDVDLERCEIRLRGELGKSRAEKVGRITPFAKPLADYLRSLGPSEGVIAPCSAVYVDTLLNQAWLASGAPSELWQGRPAHCFRKGFRSELKALGVDSEAIEYYCGRSTGMRDTYTDPRSLQLKALVEQIPPLGGPYS